MRIKELEYFNKSVQWRLNKTSFSNLTLLVGISGVGKTQILRSVWKLKAVAAGDPVNGIAWRIRFDAGAGHEYEWTGEYEDKPEYEGEGFRAKDDNGDKPRIEAEELRRNGQIIVQRKGAEIYLRGETTPKLSPFESVLSILNQEEDIAPAHESFKRIIRSDYSEPASRLFSPEGAEFTKLLKKGISLEEIQDSTLSSRLKIALLYNCAIEVFEKIKTRFIEIFPQVEDVRFHKHKGEGLFGIFEDIPILQIKEKGVSDWIEQEAISSGMYKTFMHISEMYLWKEGTVVLIDEFENSLGVNCLDILTEDLLHENRRLQFIVTSHHPYIINNISPNHWKVVTRKGGVVSTQDASELRLDSSSHRAFTQLINREEFTEGVAVS